MMIRLQRLSRVLFTDRFLNSSPKGIPSFSIQHLAFIILLRHHKMLLFFFEEIIDFAKIPFDKLRYSLYNT